MEYITTNEQLAKAAQEWGEKKEIGIDIECENNLHHYGAYIALVQISTKTKDYVVDVLAVTEFSPLIEVLENSAIEKIFHDVGFDLRIIHKEFDCRPKNLFDTQIAALLLGKEKIGLDSLLEGLGVKKEKKFQMADWTKRPLKKEMLEYAVKDTAYLIRLRDMLRKELEKKGRLAWVEEECNHVENNEWEYKEGGFFDLKGLQTLSGKERAVLKRLYALRDRLARKVDRPVHYIISTKRLVTLAQDPPKDWRRLHSVHPIVKRQARDFSDAVRKGRQEHVELPKKEKYRFAPADKLKLEKLGKLRNAIGEKLGIAGHLIMNKEQMQQMVLGKNMLRKWQKELVKI